MKTTDYGNGGRRPPYINRGLSVKNELGNRPRTRRKIEISGYCLFVSGVAHRMNIVLTGFMGTGKSAVGRKLAERLGMDFIDMDEMIEEKADITISEIFERFGEAHFRGLENQTVRSLDGSDGKVIATGGGTILNPENLSALKSLGPIICLTATPETIYGRVRHKTHRPLLEVPDPVGRIGELLKMRQPHYDKADYHIPTDGGSITITTDKILALMDKHI